MAPLLPATLAIAAPSTPVLVVTCESTVTRSNGMSTRMESQRIRVARVSQAEPSSSASSMFVASEPTSCDRTSKATTGSKSFASCGKT